MPESVTHSIKSLTSALFKRSSPLACGVAWQRMRVTGPSLNLGSSPPLLLSAPFPFWIKIRLLSASALLLYRRYGCEKKENRGECEWQQRGRGKKGDTLWLADDSRASTPERPQATPTHTGQVRGTGSASFLLVAARNHAVKPDGIHIHNTHVIEPAVPLVSGCERKSLFKHQCELLLLSLITTRLNRLHLLKGQYICMG